MFVEWIALPGVALLLLVAMLAVQEMGRRAGRTELAPAEENAGTGAILAAVFALLGLLLAFQFGGAASRLETRRSHIVQEANAIGTAYLRLDLLPPEAREPLRGLFRGYLDARIGTFQALPNMDAVRNEQHESVRLQGEIWAGVVKACDAKPSGGTNLLLIPAVNEMIDAGTVRDAGALTHGSPVISCFLVGVCLLAGYSGGRAMAPSAARPLFHMVAFAVLISATVYLILDLEYPRLGILRIGAVDRVLLELRASMR